MYATATTSAAGAPKVDAPIPTCYIALPIERDGGAGSASGKGSRVLLFCLRGIAAFCWVASRRTLERMLLSYVQSAVDPTILRSLVGLIAAAPRGSSAPAPADEDWAVRGKEGRAVTYRAGAGAGACASKKVSWSYLRGVSLALSELCQDYHYGGGRIPLSAILDLMRQHQSAFVPLGPQVEKDVPKRLIQLANEHAVFFDPFEEYVIVPEETRQKYVSRRQKLLADGVSPANLSVFGAALTQGLSPSKRMTNAAVMSYKEQFLRAQQQERQHPLQRQQEKRIMDKPRALTREESLMSIADAICPPGLRSEIESPDDDALATPRCGGSGGGGGGGGHSAPDRHGYGEDDRTPGQGDGTEV